MEDIVTMANIQLLTDVRRRELDHTNRGIQQAEREV